jgi:hypothetical protein
MIGWGCDEKKEGGETTYYKSKTINNHRKD